MRDASPVVAIADVHGRADLLGTMLDAVERDWPDARVVLLGDLIDRGPDVPAVLRLAREVPGRFPGSKVLLGNHENWLLTTLDGDLDAWDQWRTWGGAATLAAYGIDIALTPRDMRAAFEDRDPEAIVFLRDRPRSWVGDGAGEGHFFVHAGVDPRRALDDQDPHDLIWIREPFLSHDEPLERTIVHGHTIVDAPVIGAHRIGLDTGAYRSNRLTALVLESGGERRFIQAWGEWGGTAVVTSVQAAAARSAFWG